MGRRAANQRKLEGHIIGWRGGGLTTNHSSDRALGQAASFPSAPRDSKEKRPEIPRGRICQRQELRLAYEAPGFLLATRRQAVRADIVRHLCRWMGPLGKRMAMGLSHWSRLRVKSRVMRRLKKTINTSPESAQSTAGREAGGAEAQK